jgi:xanthine dehydrogenase accessory factor
MNPFFKQQAWHEAINGCHQRSLSYVLITVLTTAGSTPREAGAKMVVTSDSQFDTIGGGHLEFVAVEKARQLLVQNTVQHNWEKRQQQVIESFPLAAKLGQCCGGAVKVLFEVQCKHTQTVGVFGGGHVAQALVPILAQLPLRIIWVDNRSPSFEISTLPSNVVPLFNDDPVAEITALPPQAWAVILTHNHQLDYKLVEQGLKHPSLSFLGMIGSQTKAERFKLRLQNKGFANDDIAKMISPIGELCVAGKRPVEVAVSISAQLINLLNQPQENKMLTSEVKKEPQSLCL